MTKTVNPPPGGSEALMSRVIELSRKSMNSLNGGPFAALVVRGAEVISEGTNSVTLWNDPTAHAEIVAIRRACEVLKTFQLSECDIYSSCEPCPMCLGAIYWARPRAVYFAGDRSDAAQAGFDDAFIYDQLPVPPHERNIPMVQTMREQAAKVLAEWKTKPDKTRY
ncbi:MAG TPA: nucleoside deaminase [Candidatus Angelobacter sp.]